MPARGAVSVMVVVGPTQAKSILPGFLELRGPIPTLPEFPFGGEEKVAREVAAKIVYGSVDQLGGPEETIFFICELPRPRSEDFQMLKHRQFLRLCERGEMKSPAPMPLYGDESLGPFP